LTGGRAGAALRLATLLALLLSAAGAAAQTVRGTVIEEDAGDPLPGVRVSLLDDAGLPVDSTRTDTAGTFLLRAPRPGRFILHFEIEDYLGTTDQPPYLDAGAEVERRIALRLVSGAAARVMREVIQRETAFQLPLDELCGEPLRPWEAGLLVGVARDRRTRDPVPGALVRMAAPDAGPDDPRTTVATGTGAYWFCNVPGGRVRVVTMADGFRPDTSVARIRPGTISWYDALLRPLP
jgi:hypothetical protein